MLSSSHNVSFCRMLLYFSMDLIYSLLYFPLIKHFHDNISYWRPAIILLKSHILFNAEIEWPLSHFHHFAFHTAFLVCGLSVLTTYGIHFIANLEPWSIGLLAVLVASFIVTILLIHRQPQNQQKVAFMVNNIFSMLFSNERFGWILTSGRGAERESDGPFSGSLSLLHCHYCTCTDGKGSRCSWLNHRCVQSSPDLLRTRERVSLPTGWMCDMYRSMAAENGCTTDVGVNSCYYK